MRPSAAVVAGPAPSARMVRKSSTTRRVWRPITWAAMRSAASAAIPPNTARAMDSGLMARSALSTTVDSTIGAGNPLGRTCCSSVSTALR